MFKVVLIAGAIGKQDGAVLNALLKANADFQILALTRNAQSASAQRVLKKSPKVKLVTGNFDSVDRIFGQARKASNGPIWGVFSVAIGNGSGKSEEIQGKALVDAALKNGVQYFVYSSVDRGGLARSDTDPTTVPHFISKQNVEQYLFSKARNNEMGWTSSMPGRLLREPRSWLHWKSHHLELGAYFEKIQKLQLIATNDIGFFGAEALLQPEQCNNTKISLAGDGLTYEQFKSIFKQQIGKDLPTSFSVVAGLINWMVKDLGYMFQWFRDIGYSAVTSSVKKINPNMKDFGTWLGTESEFER